MTVFDANCIYTIKCLALIFVAAPGAMLIGVSVGRAAAEEDNQEPVIYMEHTHGGE